MTINRYLTRGFKRLGFTALIGAGLALQPLHVSAQTPSPAQQTLAQRATYADLVTMAERSEMVVRAEIRKQATVSPERAPGLAPGYARLYVEARTLALISGNARIGEALAYLVDVPLGANGKVPKLKKRQVILFARTLPDRPVTKRGQEIQLVGENAQLEYTPEFEARLRPVLTSLVAADIPPVVSGVADALAVPGTLAGESETQIFLQTADRSPASITVLRRPGQRPVWGVSWGEIIDSSARPPAPQTLEWYRLACFLPAQLPSGANLARDAAARRLAASDYAFVIEQLGPCTRAITPAS